MEDISKLLELLLEENPAKAALAESKAELGKLRDEGKDISDVISEEAVSWFRRYKDRSHIGREILKALIEKRNKSEYVKNGNVYHGFYLKESNKKIGLLSQLYGGSGLFTLVTRFNVLNEQIGEQTQEDYATERAIKSAVFDVLDYVETSGYDLNPYVDDETNKALFHPNDHSKRIEYIGAMTWALSLFVQARKAIRNKIIDFSSRSEMDNEISQEQIKSVNDRLFIQIKKIIKFFLDNKIDDKESGQFGWGYANGCTESSLFFTYSVIEAYNDFDDNVLQGKEDKELLDYLNEGIDDENEYLHIKFQRLCFDFGDRTWEIYKDTLKNNFFSDKFNGKANIVSKEDILNSGRSTALFNNLYIIFILFYSYANTRHSEAVNKEIINSMTRSLQLVQNFYNDLKETGSDSIVDMHIISFNQKNSIVEDFSKYMKDVSVQAASLLPMLVKANNLIASWILRFPQQAMTELFDEVLKNKLDNEWLWENPKYDILSTERYIEAIGDFFDYYDKYEAPYIKKAQMEQAQAIKNDTAEKIARQADIDAEVRKITKKADKDAEQRVSERIRSEYTVENAINERIDQKINLAVTKLIDKKFNSYFSDKIKAIVNYNKSMDNGVATVELSKEDISFKELLESYFESYLFNEKYLKGIKGNYGVDSVNKIKESTKEDLAEFRRAYHEFIAKHCEQRKDKVKLADIFKLIENNPNN